MNYMNDDLEALHHFEQQKAEFEEWKETQDCIDYVNELIEEVLYGIQTTKS